MPQGRKIRVLAAPVAVALLIVGLVLWRQVSPGTGSTISATPVPAARASAPTMTATVAPSPMAQLVAEPTEAPYPAPGGPDVAATLAAGPYPPPRPATPIAPYPGPYLAPNPPSPVGYPYPGPSPAAAMIPPAVDPRAHPFERLMMVTASDGWATRSGPSAGPWLSLWRTTDGGTHWKDVTPAGGAAFLADGVLDANTAWLAAPHADGQVVLERTADGGRTWTSSSLDAPEVARGYPSLPIGIDFLDARSGWLDVYGGSMHAPLAALFHTGDGGQSWTRLSFTVEGPAKDCPPVPSRSCTSLSLAESPAAISDILAFQSQTTGWATGARAGGALAAPNPPSPMNPGLLYVTHDGGKSWHYQPLPLLSGEAPATLVQVIAPPQFSSARDGIFPVLLDPTGGRRAAVIDTYVTHDAGQTWTTTPPFSLGQTDTPAVTNFADGRYGWVLNGAQLAATADGGQRWTSFTPSGLPPVGGGLTVEQLDFVGPSVGWGLVQAPHDPAITMILRTDDGGRTWKILASS
jgi:photosystem II stability/assembly factor-like uncharacterized protein